MIENLQTVLLDNFYVWVIDLLLMSQINFTKLIIKYITPFELKELRC